jgi:hypothetical protein
VAETVRLEALVERNPLTLIGAPAIVALIKLTANSRIILVRYGED